MAYAKKKKSVDTGGEQLTFLGKVREVRFYSDDSSWGFIKVEVDETVPFSIKEMDYNFETNQTDSKWVSNVVGKMPKPEIGMLYEIEGVHKYNEKYRSDQWEVINIGSTAPKTVEHQVEYLKALVTEKQARTILEQYPNIVDDVIKGVDNVDLELLKGIGQETWDKIKDKIVENFAIGDILALLIPIGISLNKVRKLLDGEKNVEILKKKLIENPYVLTAIDGISFTTADKIAVQLNPDLRVSEERLVAFIRHHLNEIGESSGDTWVEKSEIKDGVIKNVPECEKFLDSFLEKESLENKILFVDGDKIGLMYLRKYEEYIWNKLIELDKAIPLEVTEEQFKKGIEAAEYSQQFHFTEEQIDVLRNVLKSNFSTCGGRAGSGKTTISRAILNIYEEAGYSIAVAAFSAKAAQRAKEVTGFNAMTIHRLLGAKGFNSFTFDENEKLPVDVLLLDECSMLSTSLMKHVVAAIDTTKTKLVMVGDVMQLPSLSAGNTFFDIVEKNAFQTNILTKIQRQAEGSAIIADANKIRDGISPIYAKESKIIHNNEMFYLFRSDREAIFNIAISSYLKAVEEKGIDNVILISPRRQGVLNSSIEINKQIQKVFNFENENNKLVHGKREFRLKDKVLHIKNDYEKGVMNGETGYVVEVNAKSIVVDYSDKLITYDNSNLNDLDLGYSTSVFKSQGSQAKDVIITLDNSHFMLLSNQLFYTAVTRASERCLVIAEPFAFDKALEENKSIRRTWTKDFVYVR